MRKSRKIIIIVVIVVAVVAGILTLGGPYIGRYFKHKYYYDAYKPQRLEAQVIGSFSPEYHIQGVPWISHEKAYCHSTTLQMISYKHGIEKPVDYYNFIMGWTYGAVYPGGQFGFGPYNDPIPSSIAAAPYLGLEMRYLTTNDPVLFTNASRFYLSEGYPIGIQLNAAMLWNEEEFFPHSELLVGYDESGFYYFETLGEEQFIQDTEGLKVSDQLLIEAVTNINEEFARPWKFALTIYDEGERKEGLAEVWMRNGEGLIGSKFWYIANGALAIKEFASDIKESGEIKNLWALEVLSYTRLDNAVFLEQYFADDKEIKDAAELLRQADECYDKAFEIAKSNIENEEKANQVAEWLIKGAALEEEAGKIFISKGEMFH